MNLLLSLSKLSTMDKFVDQFKEYLDKTYNISISKEFIQMVVKTNMIIDNDINHVVFKDSNTQFTYINTLFKNIFGSSLTTLVNSFIKYNNEPTKIQRLEKEIENLKETIDELRDSYIRVKRENNILNSRNKFR